MAEIDHRKIYAKGFYDALRTLGIEGTSMNQAKFDSAHRELSAQAKKVYNVLPIKEAWTPSQIMKELHRNNCGMTDMRVVVGCINTMIDAGCVVEPTRGMFRRAEVRQSEKVVELVSNKKELSVAKTKLTDASALDRLSGLASRLRELAAEMETTALELAEQAEKDEADTAKMRQLQTLLKSLG